MAQTRHHVTEQLVEYDNPVRLWQDRIIAKYAESPMSLPSVTEMLSQLVASNSISSVNPEHDHGNREVLELMANWLEPLGFAIEIQPLADPRKANLIATRGEGPGGLVLAGHADTVPCNPELWHQDPFHLEERHGRLYGLGVCDMKGFFPLAMEAARRTAHEPLRQPLIILATADEESSMAGAMALVEAGRPKARYAVIGEPTGRRPVHMHKGIMVERLIIEGASGHSSNPALGRNALESMYKAIGELLDLRRELQDKYNNPLFAVSQPTMNLGCIHGGDNTNRICGDCRLDFELRPLPGMDLAAIQAEIERRVFPLRDSDGVKVRLEHFRVPPFATPDNSELLKLCTQLTQHAPEAVAFATEAPYLADLGMEVVVMGPGNIEQAHQPDEYLDLASVEPSIATLETLIRRLCV